MFKDFLKCSGLLILCISLFTACQKDNLVDNTTSENFVDQAVFSLQAGGNIGTSGCYELVFPISITFADGTSQEVSSYEELRSTIREWKENNPDSEERPTFAFPIEMIGEDGTLISVADQEELKEIKLACNGGRFGRDRPRNGHARNCSACFELVFPVSLSFPDGSSTEVADRTALKAAARAWKEANPESEERPSLVFPLEVLLDDGTTQLVESEEDLQALRESCGEE